jgi:hypothetical protein
VRGTNLKKDEFNGYGFGLIWLDDKYNIESGLPFFQLPFDEIE